MKAVAGAVVLVTFLTSIPTCTQTPAPVQLGLNHFWAVLDDTTAEAVKNSAVLPDFAHFTVQTVAPGDGRKWTGRYLTGEQTYVELFAVRDIEEPGMPAVVGSVVIGLGTDNIGGLRDLDARLRSSGLKPEMGMQKARIGGRDVDGSIPSISDRKLMRLGFLRWSIRPPSSMPSKTEGHRKALRT